MEPLQELELISLAEEVPHTKFVELCSALGYSYARGQSILATRLNHYIVAMQDILFDWKNDQTDPTLSRSVLASKLLEIGLGALGDKLSKRGYQPNQCNPRDRETARLQSSSDIYSKKISDSLTVGQCREKLVNKYLRKLCKIQMKPWDPDDYAEFKDIHTVVTVVKKDAQGRDTKSKVILQESVDDIFSTKNNGKLPARILISAPAGRGKTTAVAKMAYDWAQKAKDSAREHLPLLFVLKLRSAGQLTSIGEAIKSQLLSDVVDLTPEVIEHFIRENQGICHIILDGLDEYAGITSSKQSLGSNIVDVMLWKEFPECRVLVTTRPHLENFFSQEDISRVYSKMWIEGFSRDSSREYIDRFFTSTSNSSKGQGLKTYLDCQPLINELVITPLFCLMVCHLWSKGLLQSDTSTQTELLDSVNLFLLHHANARSKFTPEITPSNLWKIVSRLGKVALNGLLSDSKKLVFIPFDFQKIPTILESACHLGILSKTTVSSPDLPQSQETTSTTIEFYHKLAQEHTAGKYLAAKTKKYMLRLKLSKLDRVLSKIREDIGNYENLIRFAAGTDNSLCITIMEALLANRFLDESERYRILLDCSSETSSTEDSVSSLIQRCVTAQRMVLKSPTIYTVVGMQNLPEQLKGQIREVKFEDSTVSSEVTNGLWSCLRAFTTLCALFITDSSLSFPSSPPELPSVTKLKAERVTSQSYEGLLSSIPNLNQIDITIENTEDEDISRIQTSLRRHITEEELTLIRLDAYHSLPSQESVSGETLRRLGLTSDRSFREATLFGVICGPEKTVIDLVQRSTCVMSSILYSKQFSESMDPHTKAFNIWSLEIMDCMLTGTVTSSMWSCLRSFPSLVLLTISDSSLSFSPSPPELPCITKLIAERVTSQSYEGLLSSLTGLEVIDISIDDAERDISQITAGLRRTGGQQLRHIALRAPDSLPQEKTVSGRTMRGLGLLIREQTKNLQRLYLVRVKCTDEEDLVDLIECCRHVKAMREVRFEWCRTKEGGLLGSYFENLHSSNYPLGVTVTHDDGWNWLYRISHIH